MKTYCLGFCFAVDQNAQTEVALIRKVKPSWQSGFLNGIGGKVEAGETPRAAMVREFREETGAETDPGRWVCFARMKFSESEVWCFSKRMDWNKFVLDVRTTTPEQVLKVRVGREWEFEPLPNLAWLVPMALAYVEDINLAPMEIVEGTHFRSA